MLDSCLSNVNHILKASDYLAEQRPTHKQFLTSQFPHLVKTALLKSCPPEKESGGRWPHTERASVQHEHGADTGIALPSWPETTLIFSKH